MLFYKVNAMLEDEKWAEENNDRRIKQERVRLLAEKAEDYNSHDKKGNYCFIAGIDDNILCGIISYESIDAVKSSQSFFKYLGTAVFPRYVGYRKRAILFGAVSARGQTL